MQCVVQLVQMYIQLCYSLWKEGVLEMRQGWDGLLGGETYECIRDICSRHLYRVF